MEYGLEYVVNNLRAVGRPNWPAIAEASGVPLGTLKKVGSGATPDPRISTVVALAAYFRKGRKRPGSVPDSISCS